MIVVFFQYNSADIFFDYKPCTRSKYRKGLIHVQDVTRLIALGAYKYIYTTTEYRFLESVTVYFKKDGGK